MEWPVLYNKGGAKPPAFGPFPLSEMRKLDVQAQGQVDPLGYAISTLTARQVEITRWTRWGGTAFFAQQRTPARSPAENTFSGF